MSRQLSEPRASGDVRDASEESEALRGTACGKVILFGEHAVVYGVPAIAVGIERGAWAIVSPARGPFSELYVRGWNIRVTDAPDAPGSDLPLARALRDLLAATREAQVAAGRAPLGAVDVVAESDLPPGGGLGCSAACGVAVARALDPSIGASPELAAERAMVWERVFHGNPSGIDAAVSSLGGCVLFQRRLDASAKPGASGPEIQRVRVPGVLHLCLGHSGQASSTKSMVDAVARLRERRPEIVKKSFEGIETVVRNARLAIEAGDLRAVGQLLDLNQMLLSGLFLSTPEIEQMCAAAREAGAAGAKLTGAGGGGCVVALVESPAVGARVLGAWKRDGFDGFAATVGVVPTARESASIRAVEGAP